MADTIALNKLVLSPRNVRKSNGEEDICSLADSIHSKGLLQNLVVSESADKKGVYEVDAGGRRWRALQHNVALGRCPKNLPVPVVIVPRDDATEASLAENLQKVAMNPADEVEAFAAILERYADAGIVDRAAQVDNLARRFGQTPRYVEQRLRLATLAAPILDALREGRITIEAAKAYAVSPDEKLQLKVFKAEEKKSWGQHAPKTIRDAMEGKVYTADHKAVRYLGLEAYRAAGGRTAADLFLGEEERELLLDTALVDRLVKEKAETEAQQLAQADGWLDGAVKPHGLPNWSDGPSPKGFKLRWHGAEGDVLDTAARAASIASYEINEDGSGLTQRPHAFVPIVETPEDQRHRYSPETPEQRAAREREEHIGLLALHLAAPRVAGTPLEGRAFWPPRDMRWVDPVRQLEDGTYRVALLVTVTAEEYAAALDEAVRRYDAEQAELAEEEAALEAEEAAQADAEQVPA